MRLNFLDYIRLTAHTIERYERHSKRSRNGRSGRYGDRQRHKQVWRRKYASPLIKGCFGGKITVCRHLTNQGKFFRGYVALFFGRLICLGLLRQLLLQVTFAVTSHGGLIFIDAHDPADVIIVYSIFHEGKYRFAQNHATNNDQ